MTTITQDYVCIENKLNNHDKPETKSRKRKISSDAYRNKKSSKMDSKHKWNILECDPSKQGYEYDGHTMSIETQRKKTPVSLLNEWAMRNSGSTRHTKIVSYVLISITGQTHKPIFTYMCQVQDKTAKGKGLSKKEAKQNAAAQMWEKLFEIDSIANSDKVITSTTISDNFEVNKNNYTDNLTSIEGFQIIGEADSDISDKKLQHSKYAEVEIAHCNMNPIGALQELCTTYKWVPPLFSFQKSFTLNTNREQHRKYRVVSYKVTCQVFPLQTIGIAITKKEAKRIAAHKMFDHIYDIGIDKFNELKSSEFDKIMLSNKDYEKDKFIAAQKEIEKSSPEWTSAHIFQLYITTVNNKMDFVVPSYSLFESNSNLNLQKEQLEMKKNQYRMEHEQFILQYNPNLNSVNQLHSLCQKLGVQAVYTQLNNLELQQQNVENNTGQEYYSIMLQVSTLPVIVTIGRAMTVDMASEVAATDILHTFKAMWCFNSPFISKLNNNQQIANNDCITFL